MTEKIFGKLRRFSFRLYGRLTTWRMRRDAARQIGIRFRTARNFVVPRCISVNDMSVKLDLPVEEGQVTAFVEILLDDCYELHQVSLYSKINTVIDIGANVGIFCIAARKNFPAAQIHAYEPNAELRSRLEALAAQIGFSYYPEAVGRDNGAVSLVTQPGASIMTKTIADQFGTNIQVSLRNALHRIGGNVDLLKLDCEGAEWEMFTDQSIWSRVRFLTMEYHLRGGEDHYKILEVLKHVGFRVIRHRPCTTYGLILAENSTPLLR